MIDDADDDDDDHQRLYPLFRARGLSHSRHGIVIKRPAFTEFRRRNRFSLVFRPATMDFDGGTCYSEFRRVASERGGFRLT